MQIQIPELQENEKYAGITLKDGQPHENIILLPGEFSGTWEQCKEWAKSIGGELPDRQVGALLYANLKSEFENDWYWLSQQYSPVSAWVQFFGDGYQDDIHKDLELRARAVRRSPI